jgi:transposase-like protein
MGVPYHLIIKYTRGIFNQTKPIPPGIIQQIRDKVKNGQPKMHVAKELNVSLKTVRKYTEDIQSRPYVTRKISPELIEEIRTNIKDGNSKNQTAKELGVSLSIVYKYTEDLPRKILVTPRIYGRALILLGKLMKDGYAFNSPEYGFKEYQILKKEFPSIYRNKQYGKVIFYLDDKAKIATKAFFENLNKKIISYKELNQMTKSFGVELKNDEKKVLLLKNQSSEVFKNRGFKKRGPSEKKTILSHIFAFGGTAIYYRFVCW